ncbi:DUF4179 domain-containing protein [Bacillus paranthracis]|uniref:DUF4179 domain-containing protein n=1 Tax=Bacillus paranthracis TaxID=2026186 RepID=UPI0021515C9B|nr:DUF4179 domain-containing protein [Bacillus paranthracis]MCR6462655.1 DUF4179 domain-containing protein [Bacillus paranthracis]MCR9022622.1 DUF4179 domain-containing protein [Bacillus paranthracis]
MNDQFEHKLEKVLNDDVTIPTSVLKKKELAFEAIRKSKKQKQPSSHKKIVAAMIAGLTIVGASVGVGVYGDSTLAVVKEFFFAKDQGVQKAADNGYVQKVDGNHVMKDHGVTIQIKNVLYDKSKIAVSLQLKFEDKSLISKVTDLRMKYDLTDDKGRYIEKAEYTEGLTNENSKMLAGSEWSIQAGEEEGEITYNLIFHPMDSIDNIDSLNFNISSISLFAPLENKDVSYRTEAESQSNIVKEDIEVWHKNGMQLNKEIQGKWQGGIKLDSRFKGNQEIQFVPKQQPESVKIVSAGVLPTGMNITFERDSSGNDEEIKRQIKTIDSVILMDEKGKTFKSTLKGYSSAGDNGKTIKVKTFDVTIFDNVNHFKVLLKDGDGKDVVIDLAREEKK